MLTEPALGKTFFGRDNILQTLEKRVNALKGGYRQNVALTGQMLSGKSSILYQFLYNLKDTSLIPLYIEVIEEPFASFADKFIATLLYSYLLSINQEAEKNLTSLIETTEKLIPRTVHSIKRIKNELSRKKYNDAYRNLFNLTSVLREETGKSCVVILDEFHNLEFLKLKKPYLDFGKIIMIQKDTMYIVSSSQKSTIQKILSEKLALLYGNFEVIEVTGFNDKTARAFLNTKLQNVILPQKCADYLIDFTDGNPFYLDIIAKKISEIVNNKKIYHIEEGAIVEAITSLFYTTNGTVNQYFTNTIMSLLEKDLREGCLDVLVAIASGCSRAEEISKWLNKKSNSSLAIKLNQLTKLDLVYRSGSFYDLQDKVFKFWLRAVYYKKKTSLIDDIINRTNDFKEEISAAIDLYADENFKSISERVRELFLSFGDELIEIDNKQRRLPKFEKVEIFVYDKKNGLVASQKQNKLWVLEVWHENGTEAVVSDFIDRYSAKKDVVSRKICIALEGIDSNALLLAKEKNVWVWDLAIINKILRLYGKHNIIRK